VDSKIEDMIIIILIYKLIGKIGKN